MRGRPGETGRSGTSRRRAIVVASACAGVLALLLLGVALTGGLRDGEAVRDPRVFDADTPGVVRLIKAIREDVPADLYDALSAQARGDMNRGKFIRTYEREKTRTGPVRRVSVSGPFRSRDTAEGAIGSAVMRVGYGDRRPRDYSAYFLYEGSEWRFWFSAPSGRRGRG